MLRKAIQRSLTRPGFVQPAIRSASSRAFSVHAKQQQEAAVETVKPTSGMIDIAYFFLKQLDNTL
jgi:hypothetical protein